MEKQYDKYQKYIYILNNQELKKEINKGKYISINNRWNKKHNQDILGISIRKKIIYHKKNKPVWRKEIKKAKKI